METQKWVNCISQQLRAGEIITLYNVESILTENSIQGPTWKKLKKTKLHFLGGGGELPLQLLEQ